MNFEFWSSSHALYVLILNFFASVRFHGLGSVFFRLQIMAISLWCQIPALQLGLAQRNPTETFAAAASPVPQARDALRDRIESATDAQWFRSRQKKEPR